MSRLLVIRHVAHEGLGTFGAAFKAAGCAVTTLHAAAMESPHPRLDTFDGLVVMGGPMGVYEQARYPFLAREIALLQAALKRGRPVLGVCLGAQLLAAALGAKVERNPSKEIGWYPLMREPGADGDALCEAFGQTETVFQWHGDTFALPKGAVRLFSSPLCREQAFRYRQQAYGLQFHVEVTEPMVRAWLTEAGNKKELAALKGHIDPAAIRAQTARHIGRLEELAHHAAGAFCALLSSTTAASSGRAAHARH